MRRLALQQRLCGHHDGGEGKANDQRGDERGGAQRDGTKQEHAGADTREARQHQHVVRQARRQATDHDSAKQKADAHIGADESEQARARVERIADVDGDQRTETSDREEACRHREHDEQDCGMMKDEVHALHHVAPDRVDPIRRGPGRSGRRCAGRTADDDGADQRGRGEKAQHVDGVTRARPERRRDSAGRGGAQDAHAHECHLHQRVGRDEPVRRHGRADRDLLCGSEERRHAAERSKHEIHVPDGRRRNQQHRETGANQIARDERRLERPAIHEHAGDWTDEHDGKHVRDLHAGDLVGCAVHGERHDDNDGKQREKVAEQTDHLRVPHAPHHLDAEDLAKRHRSGRGRSRGVGCGHDPQLYDAGVLRVLRVFVIFVVAFP